MSQPLTANQRVARTQQIRRRLTQFRGSRRQGMLGVAEIIGLFTSFLLFLLVLISYFYFLLPAQSRLSSQQRERERLQTLLRSSTELSNKGEETRVVVQKIATSLEDFETRRLAQHAQGRMDLYDELNDLIRKNGLRNTSGPTYTSLEPVGSKAGRKSTSTKWQSVYPGIAVALTVEGQYQNLRHFVRDIENSSRFIIINAVELERATETNAPVSAEGTTGASRGSNVSLRLDMATYFQRGFNGAEAANGEQ